MIYFKNQYAIVTLKYSTSSLPQITNELPSIDLFLSWVEATDVL